jgi:hypothetical protein
MFTYRVVSIQRAPLQSLESILQNAEDKINKWAERGWELDKMMPVEKNGFSSGAILIFRQQVDAPCSD